MHLAAQLTTTAVTLSGASNGMFPRGAATAMGRERRCLAHCFYCMGIRCQSEGDDGRGGGRGSGGRPEKGRDQRLIYTGCPKESILPAGVQ